MGDLGLGCILGVAIDCPCVVSCFGGGFYGRDLGARGYRFGVLDLATPSSFGPTMVHSAGCAPSKLCRLGNLGLGDDSDFGKKIIGSTCCYAIEIRYFLHNLHAAIFWYLAVG